MKKIEELNLKVCHHNMTLELLTQYNNLRRSLVYYDTKQKVEVDLYINYYSSLDNIKKITDDILKGEYQYLRKSSFNKLPKELREKPPVPYNELSIGSIEFIKSKLLERSKFLIERANNLPKYILDKQVKLQGSRLDVVENGKVLNIYMKVYDVLNKMDYLFDYFESSELNNKGYIISAMGKEDLIKLPDEGIKSILQNYNNAIEEHWDKLKNAPTIGNGWEEFSRKIREKYAEKQLSNIKKDFSNIDTSGCEGWSQQVWWMDKKYISKYPLKPKMNSYQCPYKTKIEIPQKHELKVEEIQQCYNVPIFGVGYIIQGSLLNKKGLRNQLKKK